MISWRTNYQTFFPSSLSIRQAMHTLQQNNGQIKQRGLGVDAYSVPPNHAEDAVPTVASWITEKTKITQYTSFCLFFHDVWINFLGFNVGLISRCCSRRALVERSLCWKWLNTSFPTSSIPAILFLTFADDTLQMTFPKSQSVSLQPESERHTATALWFSMARATTVSRTVSPRLARQCGSQEKRVQASGSNLQILLNKVGTLGRKSSLKPQTQGRLEGDKL